MGGLHRAPPSRARAPAPRPSGSRRWAASSALSCGFERPVDLPDSLDFVAVLPEADGQARQVGRAERGGLDDLRPDHRHLQDVGLELHEQVVGGTRRRPRAARSSQMPESSFITSSTSATWKAIPSSAARARWPAVVPRVRPVMVPRAYWSQCGAPSPANAGTRYTPPQSGTLAASASISADDRIRPSPSRSHWTTAPPMNTLPSSA